jgi:hypothetical protein
MAPGRLKLGDDLAHDFVISARPVSAGARSNSTS